MITCHVRSEIDPGQLTAFEEFARRWMVAADALRDASGGVRRYERSSLRPLLPDTPPALP